MSTKSKNYKQIDKRIGTYVDSNLPIRIRWYEGDYWEHIDKLNGINSKNYNKKQIEVFIEDELPEIIRIIKFKNNYSTCVLSPYRYQLELLKDRLEEVLDEEICLTKKLLEDEISTVKNIAQLTIHKALGRNYDRVYIMPVEDVGQSPRLKNKEIVNVAISLAKKELCVITSAMWMSEKLQEKLLGYTIPHSKESADCYIRELLSYVDERQFHRKAGDKYGFAKTSINSIFDKVPFYRLKDKVINEKRRLLNESGTSAPEHCLFDALRHNDIIKNNFTVYREVPLKAINGIIPVNNEVQQYIENGARFDFVIANKDNIHAIIEVDGSYHRSNSEMMHKDELKNLAVKSLGKEFAERRFIRFPTDGTTKNEIERITENLDEFNDVKIYKITFFRKRRTYMIIGIKKENENLFKFNPAFGDLKNDSEYKGYIYANSEVNNFPSVFKEMDPKQWHSVSIEMDVDTFKKEKIMPPNDKGNRVIRGLEPLHFNYVMTGNSDCRYFYANLKEYYSRLVASIPDFSYILNFQRIGRDNHDAGRFYNNKNMANDIYIYQKCYGYTAVYYCMFNAFFDQIVGNYKNQHIHLHIVSIGCGIKNDALALKYAIENRKDIQFKKVKYVGIDPGNWAYKANKYLFCYNEDDEYLKIDEAPKTCNKEYKKYYVEKDIEKLKSISEEINRFAKNDASVFLIVFPNMLSEMDKNGVEEILCSIKEIYKGKNTYILLSRNPINYHSKKRIDESQAEKVNEKCYNLIAQRVSENTNKEHEWEKDFIDNDNFLPSSKTGKVREFIQLVDSNNKENSNKNFKISKNKRKSNKSYRNAIIKARFIQYEVYKLFGEEQ